MTTLSNVGSVAIINARRMLTFASSRFTKEVEWNGFFSEPSGKSKNAIGAFKLGQLKEFLHPE